MEIFGYLAFIAIGILLYHDLFGKRRESTKSVELPKYDVPPQVDSSSAQQDDKEPTQEDIDRAYQEQIERLKKSAEAWEKANGKAWRKMLRKKKTPPPPEPNVMPSVEEDEEDRLEREEKMKMRRLERKGSPSKYDFYKDYLSSSQWEAIRVKKLKEAGYKCERCQIKRATQVHHIRYPDWKTFNWYEEEEDLANLAALCDECHKNVHNIETIEVRQRKLDLE